MAAVSVGMKGSADAVCDHKQLTLGTIRDLIIHNVSPHYSAPVALFNHSLSKRGQLIYILFFYPFFFLTQAPATASSCWEKVDFRRNRLECIPVLIQG